MFNTQVIDIIYKFALHYKKSNEFSEDLLEEILNTNLYLCYEKYEPSEFSQNNVRGYFKEIVSNYDILGHIDYFNRYNKAIFSKEVYENAIQSAIEYLPHHDYSYPEIVFSIYYGDVLAWGYNPIMFNISSPQDEWKDGLIGVLAHEIHHVLKSQVIKFNLEKIDESDEGYIDFIHRIMAEGIAYLISNNTEKIVLKRSFVDVIQKKIEDLMNSLENSSFLSFMDEVDGFDGEESWKIGINSFFEYIAFQVKKSFGIEKLKECVRNPFLIIQLYNKLDGNLFDLSNMNDLSIKLERKYIK